MYPAIVTATSSTSANVLLAVMAAGIFISGASAANRPLRGVPATRHRTPRTACARFYCATRHAETGSPPIRRSPHKTDPAQTRSFATARQQAHSDRQAHRQEPAVSCPAAACSQRKTEKERLVVRHQAKDIHDGKRKQYHAASIGDPARIAHDHAASAE